MQQRILLASYHMNGEALVWFQDAENAGVFTSWDAFIKLYRILFGSTAYDNPMEALTRLKQSSNVVVYKSQFEALSNRITGLLETHKLSSFLSGLKDEIHLPVRMLAPKYQNEAFGLAKIQEYLISSKKSLKTSFDPGKPSLLGVSKIENKSEQKVRLPLQRLTSAQMEERRKQGLCYNYDEKWHTGHKCKEGNSF